MMDSAAKGTEDAKDKTMRSLASKNWFQK